MKRSPDHLGSICGVSLSRRRILTSVASVFALVACTIPLLWPGVLHKWISPTAFSLGPITQVILVAPHHFLGGQTTSLTHIWASALVSCCLGYISTLANPDNNMWVGLGILTFWAIVIPVVNSISDTTYSRITVMRIGVLNLLFILVFNKFGPEQGYALVPSVQVLLVEIFTVIVAVISNLFRYTTIVLMIPEQAAVLANCSIVFQRLVATLRLPKKKKLPTRESFELYGLRDSDYHINPIQNPSPETRRLLSPASGEEASQMEKQRDTEERGLQDIEKTILVQLDTIRSMMAESSEETWVSQAIRAQHAKVYQAIDAMIRRLVALRLAAQSGYINRINVKMIKPLRKDLDIVADQTICWIRSIETTLSECPWVEPSDAPYTHVSPIQSLLEDKNPGDEVISEHLAPNAQQARRHSELLFQGYHGAVTEMQMEGTFQVSPTSELVRFHFFLWKLSEFWKTAYVLDVEVHNLARMSASDNSWRFWPSRLGYIAKPFLNILQSGKELIFEIKEFFTEPSTRPSVKTSIVNWLREGHWRFTLRVAIGLAVLTACAIVAEENMSIDPHGVWAAVTFMIVVVPTLGGTIKRSWHRFVGTLGGAVTGFIARIVVGAINERTENSVVGPLVMILFVALIGFVATYWLHTRRHPRPYASLVAMFTFTIVALSGYPYTGTLPNGWYIAPIRALQVVIGEIAAIIICLILWDRATDKLSKSFVLALNCISIALSELTVKRGDKEIGQSVQVKEALQIIHTKIFPRQSALLKDTKSELYPFRMAQRQMWMDLVAIMRPIGSSLLSMQLSLAKGLPPKLMKLLDHLLPILSSIERLIQEDIDGATIYFREGKGKLQANNSHQIKELLRQFDQMHFETREKLIKDKMLQFYHIPLITFNAYLYPFRELAFHWTHFAKKITAEVTV